MESSYWHQPISHYLNLHLSLSFPLFTSGSKARRRGHLMSAECDPGVWSTAPSRVQAPGAQPLVRGSEGQEAKLINRIFASARLRRWLICPKICFCKTKKFVGCLGGMAPGPLGSAIASIPYRERQTLSHVLAALLCTKCR